MIFDVKRVYRQAVKHTRHTTKKPELLAPAFTTQGGRVGISGSVCGVVNPRVPGLPSQTAPSYWVPELRPAPILQTREGPRWNALVPRRPGRSRSEEHTSELQSLR